MTTEAGKYVVGDRCAWCDATPAKEYVIQKNRVRGVTYKVTERACTVCARRMGLDGE